MKIRTGNKSSHGARCYATGGRVSEDISDKAALPKVTGGPGKADGGLVDGGKAKPRLDRASKAPVSVNVIVAGKSQPEPSAIVPPLGAIPPAPPGPPMPPPSPMAGPPGPMPPMRKHGGRVNMDAGAGGGLGRLEKVKDYGKNAGKPAKGK